MPLEADNRNLTDGEGWRSTKAATKEYSFQKAARKTWIEDNPRTQDNLIKSPTNKMPCFLRGRNPTSKITQG